MELVTVREIYRDTGKYLNQKITVGGWLPKRQRFQDIWILVLHDGTFFETLQIVYHDKMENFAQVSKLNVGAAVIVTGTLIPTPEAKQPFEIQADEVVVEGASAPDYPLQKNVTALNICVPSHICVREPMRSRQCSVYVP